MSNNILTSNPSGLTTTPRVVYNLQLLTLTIGVILTIVSWLQVCSGACSEGHHYRLYGYGFEAIGIPFFGIALVAHFFSQKYDFLSLFVGAALSGAVGAEIMLVYAQKYVMGSWCPVCLSIGACVLIAFLLAVYRLFGLPSLINNKQRRGIMKSIFKGGACLFLIFFGFIFTYAGFAKFNELQAAEMDVKERIAFGDLKSPIEIYVFTDWECPACRKIEPIIDDLSPELMKKARLIYVDLAVHQESMNFTPYNLSFMSKNKDKYFKLRDALIEMALKTKSPTDAQVEEMALKEGVKYEQMNYADIALGIKYFQHLAKQFNVDRTPTVVIVNKEKKKGKKLIGGGDITEKNILNSVKTLSE